MKIQARHRSENLSNSRIGRTWMQSEELHGCSMLWSSIPIPFLASVSIRWRGLRPTTLRRCRSSSIYRAKAASSTAELATDSASRRSYVCHSKHPLELVYGGGQAARRHARQIPRLDNIEHHTSLRSFPCELPRQSSRALYKWRMHRHQTAELTRIAWKPKEIGILG
jgi:hypothetical protein